MSFFFFLFDHSRSRDCRQDANEESEMSDNGDLGSTMYYTGSVINHYAPRLTQER